VTQELSELEKRINMIQMQAEGNLNSLQMRRNALDKDIAKAEGFIDGIRLMKETVQSHEERIKKADAEYSANG